MKSRYTLVPALGLALCALLVAGCSKGGGGSSGGSSSSSSNSSSSGGSGSPTGGANGGTGTGGGGGSGGGSTSAAGPPAPSLGYAYHTAVLAYYYFYHKKDTIVWGDVGANWGHYDQDTYESVLDPGYGSDFPDFEEATVFGAYYDRDELPPIPPSSIPPHDTTPVGDPDGIITYDDMIIDATACYTSLLDTTTYPPTATYTGTYVGTTTYTAEAVYEQDLAALSAVTPLAPGKYHFNSDAKLTGTLTLNGGPDDVWVFQIEGNLYVRGAAKVVLTGGAVAQNVWWQVGVEIESGEYVSYDPSTGHYIYNFIPGAYIGDDPAYPPYNDPSKTGYSSFQGNILCWGDVAVGRGSNVTGRVMSLYYGWWHYAAVIHGSVTINATKPLAMGTANNFALLAEGSITNSGETAVKGKVGVATGTSPPRPSVLPDLFEVEPTDFWLLDPDPASDVAIAAALAARTEANLRDLDYDLSTKKLQGRRLPPGVYLIDSAAFTGTSTDGPVLLDGLNDPTSTWIFRTSGAMSVTTASGIIQFIYENGANPDNVYWVCSSCTIAPSVSLRGTILTSSSSASAIYLDYDATLQGRAISTGTGGGISLHGNTVFSDSTGGQLAWVKKTDAVPETDDEASSVASDGASLYVFGFQNGSGSGSDSWWRLEKRDLATGELDLTFGGGTGFRSWNPGSGNDIPRRILVDGTGIYLFGSQEDLGSFQWRLEKRSLATGLPDATFGGGAEILTALPYGGLAGDMGLSGTTLYLTGEMNDVAPFTSTRIRIEKRSTSTGAYDTSDDQFYSPTPWYDVPDWVPPAPVGTPGSSVPGAPGPTTMRPDFWRPLYGGPYSDVRISGAGWYDVPAWVEPVDPIPPGYYLPGTSGLTTLPPAAWDPPYTGDPAAVLVRPATEVGVVVDDSSIYPRGARCITIVPVPADIGGLLPHSSEPFMIVGGWQSAGIILSGLYQKRFLTDGRLDVGNGYVAPPYPGYSTGGADGTQTVTFAGYRNIVQSVANDGTSTFGLLSADYAGAIYPGFASIPGMSYWIVEKRSMQGFVPLSYPGPGGAPVSGGSPSAEPHYALGIYGPVPYAEYESDFSCSALSLDSAAKRFFIAGCNTGVLGGELWRIEKRKDSTLVLDALFNTSGSRPGMLEVDPEPGQSEVLPQWYVYNSVTYSYYWTSKSPLTDPETIWVAGTFPDEGFGWTPASSYYRAGTAAVPGRPDRCRAITFVSDKIYIVGSDASDPSHLGQWRIESRNR